MEAVADEVLDVFHILRTLETVAHHEDVGRDGALLVQGLYNINVEGGRGLDVDVVFQHLLQHERKVRTFRAVAIMVVALIVHLGHGHVEHAPRLADVLGYLGQVSDAQRRAILLDKVHDRHAKPLEFVFHHGKLIVRKLERLFNQIDILILHTFAFKCG